MDPKNSYEMLSVMTDVVQQLSYNCKLQFNSHHSYKGKDFYVKLNQENQCAIEARVRL